MNYHEMTTDQLLERRAAIAVELEKDDADLTALNQEARAINAELESRRSAEARRAEIRSMVAAGAGASVATHTNSREERQYTRDSAEYRRGFLNTLLGNELTAEERSAVTYVATTGDSTYHAGYVLPTELSNEIWDLIESNHSILRDITLYRTGTVFEIAVRSAISQGDATSVSENAANDDEINTFAKVTLSGKDFSKHVDITYAMAKMSIDAFEDFLVSEISDRIGAALAADVVAQIKSDYYSSGNAVTTAAENKVAFTDVASAFSKLKNAKGNVVVYGSNAGIFKYLVGMCDSTGRPIFQADAQEGAAGKLIGASVEVEDALGDAEFLIGYPKQVVGNMIQDIMVESDRDIKKHVITHSGYARFECKLVAPKAFALLSVDLGE